MIHKSKEVITFTLQGFNWEKIRQVDSEQPIKERIDFCCLRLSHRFGLTMTVTNKRICLRKSPAFYSHFLERYL